MMKQSLCAFALAACLALPAYAQKPEPAPLDPVARAEAFIREQGAQGLFVAEPEQSEGLILVRHVASGMRCRINPGEGADLGLFAPEVSGAALGEDVSCNSRNRLNVDTFYATRYPTPQTLEMQMELAVGQIRARFRALEEVAPGPPDASFPPEIEALIPESRTAQFIVRDGERPFMTRVSIAIVDGWTIKMRWTGALGTDGLAGASWTHMLIDLVRHRCATAL
jgi:hypothetical protein